MARDPTLFTQTGPTATSKAPYRGTTIPIEPAPPGETPSQKVARLRAAAQRAKLSQGNTWDRVVHRGRIFADAAHRTTATALIGFSVFFGVYTVLCFGDMIVYNRRKRVEFYAVMEKLRADEYDKALEAERNGVVTDDQRLLLNQERARFQQMQIDKKKKEKGVWKRMKESVVGTESYEEQPGGKLGIGKGRKKESVTDAVGNMLTQRDQKVEVRESLDPLKPATNTLVGGPLDRLGQDTANSVTRSTRSWTDWALRR